jgi:ATP-dependent RNA helicase DDX54/DBP10
MYFFAAKQQDKEGALMYLLSRYIPKDQQTVIFASTKHHVEYITELIRANGYSVTYIYGALDQAARMGNLARFRNKKMNILVVTDVAARGIDIPLLDNVVNYDFPPSSKLFIHRVGRTARAGKTGSAWSLVSAEELPHLLDMQLFTGRPLIFASHFENKAEKPDYTSELVYGEMPMAQVSLESESLAATIKGNITLETMRDSAKNAYKMYLKSRPAATKASYDRAKELSLQSHGIHPIFGSFTNSASQTDEKELNRYSMVKAIAGFRPPETVFEVTKRGSKSAEAILMQKRRAQFSKAISETHSKWAEIKQKEMSSQANVLSSKHIVQADDLGNRKHKDSSYYIQYRPADEAQESGYSVHNNNSKTQFVEKARQLAMDMVGDDVDEMRKRKADLVWDSTKHRFQREQVGSDNKKRIKTDAGTVVLATYKTERCTC